MRKIVKFLFLIFGFAFSNSLLSQYRETIRLVEFEKLVLEGDFSIQLIKNDSLSLKMETMDEALNGLKIENLNGQLKLSNSKKTSENLKLVLYYHNLKRIEVSGNVQLKNEEAIFTNDFAIQSSGYSKVNLKIIANKLEVLGASNSKITLSGATDSIKVELNDRAELNSTKLSSNYFEILSSGFSRSNLSVNRNFQAKAEGYSEIKYSGNPLVINLLNSSTSKIEKVDKGDLPSAGNSMGDTTKLKFGKKQYIIIEEGSDSEANKKLESKTETRRNSHKFKHWTGLELGFNNWTGQNRKLALPDSLEYLKLNTGFKSITFNLNFLQRNFHIYKNHLNFVTGLGLGFQSYNFRNDIRLNPDSNFTYFFSDTLKNFKRNKLSVSYFHLPLMLEFNSSSRPSKTFHVALGVICMYKLSSKTKRKYEINGYRFEEIRKDDYNINSLRLDASARIGFRNFCLFSTYSLNSFFENNRGASVFPFVIGLRIIPLN